MATLDKPMGRVAKTLLKKFGRSAVLRRGGPAAYDTPTGYANASTTDIPCEVVFEEFSEGQHDGTLVQVGDRRAIVSRLRIGVEPKPDADKLVEGGRVWRIVRVIGFSSGASEAAYQLHVRR
jgi:hypothetical protein